MNALLARKICVSIVMLMTCVVCWSGAAAYAQDDDANKNYIIGSEDVLDIKVWDHDDLSRTVTVSADGYFSFPLIGRIKAGGLTVRSLETKIAQLLDKDYIVNPQVTITVADFKSQKVFILGEVKSPGAYYLSKNDTVLEVISKAGGVTPNAGREIIIARPKQGATSQPASLDSQTSQLQRVNLQALLAGDVQKNVSVQDNDTIYVPKASQFSVFGEVQKPGSYMLENDTSILEAISIAGGPTSNADTQKLELLRKENGAQRKIVLNIKQLLEARTGDEEFLIQDGDVIYQPRAEFFFVMGEVNKPGSYKLEEGTTVTKAISLAGGFTDKAGKKKIKILREKDGKQTEHKAEPNELLQPQDVVQVPQSLF
ncbi:polysaccharide export protein [Candidatus Moduliflexus flocculans]|uniref:Polysaccharide export protein n=1 Tax=Candidatus Moduliflexus flocculans TaxID=1499966 RepID=A0A081BRD6_9BACT|nr:polysaccharide export protein [Candidatus Moduliflexus flocculans]